MKTTTDQRTAAELKGAQYRKIQRLVARITDAASGLEAIDGYPGHGDLGHIVSELCELARFAGVSQSDIDSPEPPNTDGSYIVRDAS